MGNTGTKTGNKMQNVIKKSGTTLFLEEEK